MRRIILGVGLMMLLLPLAAWCEGTPAPLMTPADPAAACASATAPAIGSADGPQTLIGAPALRFLSTCTCTTERQSCKNDCLGNGCLGIIFTCYTPDPCLSDCTCTRCIA
jgi:hypothetical protein